MPVATKTRPHTKAAAQAVQFARLHDLPLDAVLGAQFAGAKTTGRQAAKTAKALRHSPGLAMEQDIRLMMLGRTFMLANIAMLARLFGQDNPMEGQPAQKRRYRKRRKAKA